jgi:uncharacterized membrane protein HdeD (DUF308 family)
MVRRVMGVCVLNVGGFAIGVSLLHLLPQVGSVWPLVVGVAALSVSILLESSDRHTTLRIVGAIVALLGGVVAGLAGPMSEPISPIVIAAIFLVSGVLLVFWPEECAQKGRKA